MTLTIRRWSMSAVIIAALFALMGDCACDDPGEPGIRWPGITATQ